MRAQEKAASLILSGGDAPVSTTSSPARRRLRAALASSYSVETSPPPAPAKMSSAVGAAAAEPEAELVLRTGAKVSGKYAVVTAYYLKPKLRFEIYVQSTCTTHEIVMTHADVEASPDAESRLGCARAVVSDLLFDERGKVVLGPSVPAVWCS